MNFISKLKKKKISSFQMIILGFIGLIIMGALILMLPISSAEHQVTPFNVTLFTSTSAVCVTGLVLKDTATYWSYFGQAVILVLIQIGGLGVVTVASLMSLIVGRKISLMQRTTIQNQISAPQVGGVVVFMKFVFIGAFTVEFIGILLLLPFFCMKYSTEGIWMSIFHSISAFCNAGFDLMGAKSGQFSSLTAFGNSLYLTIVISLLIILGGLGFATWNDFIKNGFKIKNYRLQSKVILLTTFILIFIPFLLYFFVDFAGRDMMERVCLSIFQAVTPRTAGFNTVDFSEMSDVGRGVMMFLMLIGGSPGSTAGGLKTTTLAVIFVNMFAVIRGRENANCFGRRIADDVVKNASALLGMYFLLAFSGAIIISLVDGVSVEASLFETISAVATVGLTLGITQSLGSISQIVLIILMFFGRVGGLTFIYATFSHKDTFVSRYPIEDITVG